MEKGPFSAGLRKRLQPTSTLHPPPPTSVSPLSPPPSPLSTIQSSQQIQTDGHLSNAEHLLTKPFHSSRIDSGLCWQQLIHLRLQLLKSRYLQDYQLQERR